MYVHAIVLDTGKDVFKSLDSVLDCDTKDVISRKFSLDFYDQVYSRDAFLTTMTPIGSFEDQINKLVEKTDSNYVFILESGDTIDSLVEKLKKYRENHKLSMIKPESGLSKLLVQTPVWRWMKGFGVGDTTHIFDPVTQQIIESNAPPQSIVEKIEIQAKNEGNEHLILNSVEELCG